VTDKEIIYAGRIAERPCGEDDYALFIGDADRPFADQFEDALEEHGRMVTVRYFITDEHRTIEELTENHVRMLVGAATAEYSQRYSEITGYLWTDAELNVGGHDLLTELRDHAGRYLHMTVMFHGGQPAKESAA